MERIQTDADPLEPDLSIFHNFRITTVHQSWNRWLPSINICDLELTTTYIYIYTYKRWILSSGRLKQSRPDDIKIGIS